jgi:hypothetical protein
MKHNTIIIKHPKLGKLVHQTFENSGQFKLFLMGVHGPLELKTSLNYFNGEDFFVNIPYKVLSESIVMTKYVGEKKGNSLSQHFKSRMEAEVIKES